MQKKLKHLNVESIIDITSFGRNCFDYRGFHLSKWGKLRLVKAIVDQVVNKAHEVPSNLNQANKDKSTTTDNVSEKNLITIVDAYMNELFDELMYEQTLGFANCISADFAMLRGVAVTFRRKCGRPRPLEYVNKKLTCQTIPNGSSVWTSCQYLYFDRPTDTDYDKLSDI